MTFPKTKKINTRLHRISAFMMFDMDTNSSSLWSLFKCALYFSHAWAITSPPAYITPDVAHFVSNGYFSSNLLYPLNGFSTIWAILVSINNRLSVTGEFFWWVLRLLCKMSNYDHINKQIITNLTKLCVLSKLQNIFGLLALLIHFSITFSFL